MRARPPDARRKLGAISVKLATRAREVQKDEVEREQSADRKRAAKRQQRGSAEHQHVHESHREVRRPLHEPRKEVEATAPRAKVRQLPLKRRARSSLEPERADHVLTCERFLNRARDGGLVLLQLISGESGPGTEQSGPEQRQWDRDESEQRQLPLQREQDHHAPQDGERRHQPPWQDDADRALDGGEVRREACQDVACLGPCVKRRRQSLQLIEQRKPDVVQNSGTDVGVEPVSSDGGCADDQRRSHQALKGPRRAGRGCAARWRRRRAT